MRAAGEIFLKFEHYLVKNALGRNVDNQNPVVNFKNPVVKIHHWNYAAGNTAPTHFRFNQTVKIQKKIFTKSKIFHQNKMYFMYNARGQFEAVVRFQRQYEPRFWFSKKYL